MKNCKATCFSCSKNGLIKFTTEIQLNKSNTSLGVLQESGEIAAYKTAALRFF
jgi:hypothetical protein